MKCDKVIQSFLNQNDSRYPSLVVRLHTFVCPKCKEEIRGLSNIFVKARTSSSYVMPRDLSKLVMRRIFNSNIIYEKNVSSSKWIVTGVIIFASIFMVSYSESFIWLKSHFGGGLEIPLYIVLGMVITIYSASYIGTHLDGLKKAVEFVSNRINL